jgi:hypothetical protein
MARAKFPATYAYVCASKGRLITEEDAIDLIRDCDAGLNDERGLAIWSFGQMGMWSTLERIQY